MTTLPIEVPIARNLLPLVEMHVGTPTPFDSELFISNSSLTFLRIMYTMF